MIVRNGGREFAHFALEDVPPDAGPPSIRGATGTLEATQWWTGTGRSWDLILADLDVEQAQIDDGTVCIARVLVTTPDAPPGPGVLFLAGTTPAELVLTDSSEIVIRGDGRITVL
jgi:hypothetical protein